jgi:RNA 2',3'-cyclic 3'-phosphodiesterase
VRDKKDTRLFFALWPDSGLRARLHAAAGSIALSDTARRVPRANLHLTLHFIGNVYFEEMTSMREQARLVEAAPFRLDIDCQGFFSKPRVAWLGSSQLPDELGDLHRQLGTRLQSCGFRPETRPYHPHVTVARKTGSIVTDIKFLPLCWQVDEFALIEVLPVENGVQYRVVETYPLR